MRIIELELTNFKGERSLLLAFNGASAKIRGDNATGKTTVMDAFIWLLTGKDHMGRSDMNFNIKTLDSSGAAIPMIDHSVRAKLEHDGLEFEMLRTFREVWQKKTGTNVQTFNGHKTEYYIDGVPKSEKEYPAFIERIAPVQLLNLLTMPAYFNEQLKAEDRRKMLLEMCGDVDENEMLTLPEFSGLAPHITRMVGVADLKKAKAAQKTKINDEIKSIPVAINVHMKYMDVDGLNISSEQAAAAALQEQITKHEADLTGISNGETLSRHRKELAELEEAYIRAKSDAIKKTNDATEELREEYQKLKQEQQTINGKIHDAQSDIGLLTSEKNQSSKDRERLLARYHDVSESHFDGEDTCPTCGQDLPSDKVQAATEQFNENKSKQLEEIMSAGKSAAASMETMDNRIAALTENLGKLKSAANDIGNKLASLTGQISEVKPVKPDFDTSRIDAKKDEIYNLMQSTDGKESALTGRISDLREQKAEHERNISRLQNAENAAREIDALKAKEKELAAAYEECEGIIAMCDDFTNARVKMLDERISGFFRVARFKLTETLVNGGLREICDTLIDGVPYSAANNAARINVGLDIIASFARHYGISLPVFIDNAESVTALDSIDAQTIQLIVSEQDKKLNLEVA